MKHNQNPFTPEAATDEPASPLNFGSAQEADAYWAGVADGLARAGGQVPRRLRERACEAFPELVGIVPEPPPDQGPGAPDFDPVPVRARHDGFTPEKQRAFIEELADTGCVAAAAAKVGMTGQSATRLRRRADARSFDRAWDAATLANKRTLSAIAWDRAVNGTVKRHYYHGELKSEEIVHDNRLLIYLLGKADSMVERPAAAAQVLRNWEPWMDAVEQGLPEPPPRSDDEDEWDGTEVMQLEGEWWTTFPPPPGFDGVERGCYGDFRYLRSLTEAEQAVIDADLAERRRNDGRHARRDRYFGFEGDEDSSSRDPNL
ncbi:MAG TPA: hypothetical protein VF693_01850 [Allosphingosinicella sp.]|jgi:hypothetical protein